MNKGLRIAQILGEVIQSIAVLIRLRRSKKRKRSEYQGPSAEEMRKRADAKLDP